jgi:carbonic anhydrase
MVFITIIAILSFLCVVKSPPVPPPDYANQDTADGWIDLCATGLQQSPIDFAKNVSYRPCNEVLQVEAFSPVVDGTKNLALDDSGFYFDLSGTTGALKVRLNNYEYTYADSRCEFHVPAEHKIHGKQYDMEFECWFDTQTAVSSDTNSLINTARTNYIVFSVLFERHDHETDFPELSNFALNSNVAAFDLERLFNLKHGFYHYYGSDNSPNFPVACNEETLWAVMRKPLKINDQQYYFLRESLVAGNYDGTNQNNYPVGNARNVQPLNNRVVYTCRTGEESSDEESHHHHHHRDSLSFLDDSSSSSDSSRSSDSFSFSHHEYRHRSDSSSD